MLNFTKNIKLHFFHKQNIRTFAADLIRRGLKSSNTMLFASRKNPFILNKNVRNRRD